jgi:hypothetical protein
MREKGENERKRERTREKGRK